MKGYTMSTIKTFIITGIVFNALSFMITIDAMQPFKLNPNARPWEPTVARPSNLATQEEVVEEESKELAAVQNAALRDRSQQEQAIENFLSQCGYAYDTNHAREHLDRLTASGEVVDLKVLLQEAVCREDEPMVKELLIRGANPNTIDARLEKSLVSMAIESGKVATAHMLVMMRQGSSKSEFSDEIKFALQGLALKDQSNKRNKKKTEALLATEFPRIPWNKGVCYIDHVKECKQKAMQSKTHHALEDYIANILQTTKKEIASGSIRGGKEMLCKYMRLFNDKYQNTQAMKQELLNSALMMRAEEAAIALTEDIAVDDNLLYNVVKYDLYKLAAAMLDKSYVTEQSFSKYLAYKRSSFNKAVATNLIASLLPKVCAELISDFAYKKN